MYHDIIPLGKDKAWSGLNVKGADAYKINAEVFESQVAFAAELRDKTKQEVIFTFDDGGISAINTTALILGKYQFKGIFFIPTALIGQEGFLSRDDIKTLYQDGHIIGTHSHTHPIKMNRMVYEDMMNEWRTSISILSQITFGSIEYASVPGGWYSRKVGEASNQAGIKQLFNSEPTQNTWIIGDCKVSGRFAIREQMSMNSFENLLSGKGMTRELLSLRWGVANVIKLLYELPLTSLHILWQSRPILRTILHQIS